MSWEETLRAVVRKYYRSGVVDPPDWVTEQEESTPDPVTVSNATCGDRVVVYVEATSPSMERDGRIWLDAAGCAICKASAEMVVSAANRVSRRELIELAKQMGGWLHASGDSAALEPGSPPQSPPHKRELPPPALLLPAIPTEDLEAMLMVRDVPGRRRCASLPWEAVLQAVDASR